MCNIIKKQVVWEVKISETMEGFQDFDFVRFSLLPQAATISKIKFQEIWNIFSAAWKNERKVAHVNSFEVTKCLNN